ncbi:hypothetical protein CUMW_238190 [Citrus unshiu]|uniref:Protein kinase domain-containing protein n=1 Tax=Citrus unshiu TaxID=55188 RepID=A0A2H5QK90_CITUN|nr:hypothetical protein CUMW_238190 [Citrus unshiu]
MVVHHYLVLLQSMFLPLWPIKASKDLCQYDCGNATIRYPFGIREGCYFDKSFEVICDYSSGSPKAFLASINNLQVLDNHVYGVSNIRVNIPVISLKSSNLTSNAEGVSLSVSPFTFSPWGNRFTAIGCNNYTMIIKRQNDSSVFGGCLSISTCDPALNPGCYDFLCALPQNITQKYLVFIRKVFLRNVTLFPIVEEDWINSKYMKNPHVLKDHGQVPALLKWAESRGYCYEEYNSKTTCNKDNICCSSGLGISLKEEEKPSSSRISLKEMVVYYCNNSPHQMKPILTINIVKLFRCCLEIEVPLLVYEFIPNGTLYRYIHDQTEEFTITWEIRLCIDVEVSGALSYLHSTTSIPIYHRDIKSANILLDDKFRAKISDFGASRYVTIDQTHLTTRVQGTFGYLDLEYFRSSQFTKKGDVYSFGVVFVGLLTGQKPIRSTDTEEDKSLAGYFLRAMKENCLFDMLDAQVLKEAKEEEIITVAMLAKRCLNLNGRKRPTMKEVAFELGGIRASIGPQNCEGIDFVGGNFETGSSSTGAILNDVAFSVDADPLLSNKW